MGCRFQTTAQLGGIPRPLSSRAKRGIPFGSGALEKAIPRRGAPRDDRMNDRRSRRRGGGERNPLTPSLPSLLSSRAKRGIPFGSGALEKGIPRRGAPRDDRMNDRRSR